MSRSAQQPTGLVPPVGLPSGWTNVRLALGFHAVVAVVAVGVLALPWPELGWRVTAVVVGYHLGVLAVGRWSIGVGWTTAWLVLAPLSVLMVLPDSFLASVLGTLEFADTGAPFIGTVPVFMAGMWVMALLPLVLVAAVVEKRAGPGAAVAAVAAAGLVLFYGAELVAPIVPLWEPVDVAMVAGVAGYVLPAEVLLSVGSWLVVRGVMWRTRSATVVGVLALPVVYTGALALGYQVLG